MEATCIVCGKEIPKPKSGRASKKYCSTACYQKDYREKNDKILKEKSREKKRIRLEEEWKTKDSIFCAVCGEKIEFSIPQRTVYCSDSCLEKNYLAAHEKRRRDEYRKEYDNNISNKERANKLTAFQLMSPRNKLRFTTDKEEAKTFKLCYCRTLLCSSQGRGIVVARSPEEVVDAPLYTKGIIRVAGEYRVHVFKGQIIDVVQKKKLSTEQRELRGIGDVNPYIRNHSNGYIFAREDISYPDSVKTVALNAIEDLQLDFGAVDVVVSGYSGGAFVLEANSAPGLEGTTVQKYVEAIEGWYE